MTAKSPTQKPVAAATYLVIFAARLITIAAIRYCYCRFMRQGRTETMNDRIKIRLHAAMVLIFSYNQLEASINEKGLIIFSDVSITSDTLLTDSDPISFTLNQGKNHLNRIVLKPLSVDNAKNKRK